MTAPAPSNMTMDHAIERLGMGKVQYRLVLAAGLNTMSDAMEIVLLTFLTLMVEVEWQLTTSQASLLTSAVFIGALLGTLVLGPMADSYGRKPLFVGSGLLVSVCGAASAFAPNYTALLLLRFGVGLGIGGIVVPYGTIAEFVPKDQRGTMLVAVGYFWTVGMIAVPAVAFYAIERKNSWRLFVFVCSLPIMLSTVLTLAWVKESPRWLLIKDRPEDALKVLRECAVVNGLDPEETFPEGITIVRSPDEDTEVMSFRKLLRPKYRNLNLLIWVNWVGLAFLYWGTIQVVTMVFSTGSEEDDIKSYEFDYKAIFWSSFSEVAGLCFSLMTVNAIGRVPSSIIGYAVGSVFVMLLCFFAYNDMGRRTLLFTAFCARLFMDVGMNSTWTITPELLPTEIRATGHSVANAIARIGGALTPFLVSRDNSLPRIGVVLGTMGFLTCVAASFLPETQGFELGTQGRRLSKEKIKEIAKDDEPSESETSVSEKGEL